MPILNDLLRIAKACAPCAAMLSVTCCPLNPSNPFDRPSQSGAAPLGAISQHINLIDYRAWSAMKARAKNEGKGELAMGTVAGEKNDAVWQLYTNPVWQDYFADPFVLRNDNQYYAYGTAPIQENGHWFPVLRSTDLMQWNYLGGSLKPLTDPRAKSYWAPAVVQRGEKFYMYYSAGGSSGEHHQIRLATAKQPSGPFVDQGRTLLPDEPFTIDGHPFQDPQSGRWYLFFTKEFLDGDRPGTGVAMVELGDDMMSVKGPVKTVVRAHADWQILEHNRHWRGKVWKTWHTVEGPAVLYRNGRYYCLYSGGSANSKNYGVGFAHAENIDGPWIDDQDAHGASVLSGVPEHVLGPGHNSVITAPDGITDIIVYHAWDSSWTTRRICVDKLKWTDKGPHCQPTWQPSTLFAKER